MAIGAVASIAGVAMSVAALAYQASRKYPSQPGTAKGAADVSRAQMQALPSQRQIQAAEQKGEATKYWVPAHKEYGQYVRVPKNDATALSNLTGKGSVAGMGAMDFWVDKQGKLEHFGGRTYGKGNDDVYVKYNAADFERGGRFYGKKYKTVEKWAKVPAGYKQADFTGYGTADVEGRLANEMADIAIAIGDKYGVEYAKESARQAEQADPEGTKARQIEHDLIQKNISNPPPISPLSGMVEGQVQGQLSAGKGFDPMTRDLLDKSVAEAAAARGGGPGSADVARSLSTGSQGMARQQAAFDKSRGFLSSGSTPEDIAYRREQQNMANLGAFVGGRTPESQFANLSSAGQGAAPMYGGQPMVGMPSGGAGAGSQYTVAGWQANMRARQNQANPWLAGISSLMTAAGTYNSAAGNTAAGNRT